MIKRLDSLNAITGAAKLPLYNPANHGCGIVHVGVGAFHRAHQAVYTDDAIAAEGGDWRMIGISLRSTDIADALNPQNGLYTLIERGAQGTSGRIIASIDRVIAANRDVDALLPALTSPQTRIVTLTVTEKAYGIDRIAMAANTTHPAVAADLSNPQTPVGVLGLLVEALRLRRSAGIVPFSVLCCDNLPENGALLRAGVIDFARRLNPDLAQWIETEVSFPSSMVDRITPAATSETLEIARKLTGCMDHAAVETETFHQWVIEDTFPNGRPAWEAGGALFVKDVKPYELMKLRMLNGAHSMLAYAGFLSGHKYVRDVMEDRALAMLVDRHMFAAQKTLPRLKGIDLDLYRQDLLTRFRNPAIAHETCQIAMDGTEKLPQRILAPARDAIRNGQDFRPFAFAVAAWMRYCLGSLEDGRTYSLRDPLENQIRATLDACSRNAEDISKSLHNLNGLFDPDLANHCPWRALVIEMLDRMLSGGMASAIKHETCVMTADG